MMHTKRPHKKTRNGCQSCKDRRVKCDELRPQCTSCKVRSMQCHYLVRTSSVATTRHTRKPSHTSDQVISFWQANRLYQPEMFAVDQISLNPPPPYPSTHAKLHDMRLLHHYCTVTIETMGVSIPLNAGVIRVWQKEVPQLAFEHDFLMDNLLALASVHMDHVAPLSANHQMTALYQDRALRVFREAVAKFSKENFLAVIIASTLLSPSSLVINRKANENRLWSVDWLVMHTGVGAILKATAWTDILESCIAPIFNIQMPDPAPTLIPIGLQQILDSIKKDDLDASYRDILNESIVCLGGLYGRIAHNGLNPTMAIDIMRWPYTIPVQFRDLAKAQLPHTLVILAHFIILFEFLPQLWWVSDVAEHEVDMISLLLGPQWQPLLAFPKMAVHMKDQDRILDLLLSQLPEMDRTGSLRPEHLFFHTSDEYIDPKNLDIHSSCRDIESLS